MPGHNGPYYISLWNDPTPGVFWATDKQPTPPVYSTTTTHIALEIPYLYRIDFDALHLNYLFYFYYKGKHCRFAIEHEIVHEPKFDLVRQLMINVCSEMPLVPPHGLTLTPKQRESVRQIREDQIRKKLTEYDLIKPKPKAHNAKFQNIMQQVYGQMIESQLELDQKIMESIKKGLLTKIEAQKLFPGSDHGSFGPTNPQPKSISEVSKELPGMDYAPSFFERMSIGCNCSPFRTSQSLWGFIQHLNDNHRFSREKIADWLDALHDSGKINLEFEPWKEETNAAADKD